VDEEKDRIGLMGAIPGAEDVEGKALLRPCRREKELVVKRNDLGTNRTVGAGGKDPATGEDGAGGSETIVTHRRKSIGDPQVSAGLLGILYPFQLPRGCANRFGTGNPRGGPRRTPTALTTPPREKRKKEEEKEREKGKRSVILSHSDLLEWKKYT
jgi:hypothetical protein